MIFQRGHTHLYVFVEGWYVDFQNGSNLYLLELILTDVECSPDIIDHGDAHNGTSQTDEFADLRIDSLDFTVSGCTLYGLFQYGTDHVDGGPCGLCLLLRRFFRLLPCTVFGKFPLRLGSLYAGFRCFVGCHGLVTFLCCHYTFVIEPLHTPVGLLRNTVGCNGLLVELVGTFYGLVACRCFGQCA